MVSEKNKLEMMFVGAVFSVIAGLGALAFILDRSDARVYERVRIKADTDQNRVVSNEEWAAAYQKLGKTYSIPDSNPRKDLSKREMKTYLANL